MQGLLIDHVHQACSASSAFEPKSDKLKEVLKLGLAAARITPKLVQRSQTTTEGGVWSVDALEGLAQELKESSRYSTSSALRDLLRQLISIVAKADGSAQAEGAQTAKKTKSPKRQRAEEDATAAALAQPSKASKKHKSVSQ